VQHPTAVFFPGYVPPAAPAQNVESYTFDPDALVSAALSTLTASSLLGGLAVIYADGTPNPQGMADLMAMIPALVNFPNFAFDILSGASLNTTSIRTVLVSNTPVSPTPPTVVIPPAEVDAIAGLIPIIAGAAGGAVFLMILFAVYCLYCRKEEDDDEAPREKLASSRPSPSARLREGAGGAGGMEPVFADNPLRRVASADPAPRITREQSSSHAIGSPRKAPVGRGYVRPAGNEIAVPPPPRRGSRAEPEPEVQPEVTVVQVGGSRQSRAAFAPTISEDEGAGTFSGVSRSVGRGGGVRSHSNRSSSFRGIPGIPEAVVVATPKANTAKTGVLPKGAKGGAKAEDETMADTKAVAKGAAKTGVLPKGAKGGAKAEDESKADTKGKKGKAFTTK